MVCLPPPPVFVLSLPLSVCRSLHFSNQRASCSRGTTSPPSATSLGTSCAEMESVSQAGGSVTDCPTALTRVTKEAVVSPLHEILCSLPYGSG